MIKLDHANICEVPPKAGDLIVIRRKIDKQGDEILCKVREVVWVDNSPEIILSAKNDYFIWDLYKAGKSWVWRVWNLGPINITAITNTTKAFPRR